MSILIFSEPDDVHAVLIRLALEQKGQDCDLFFSADMPSKQRNSFYFTQAQHRWHTRHEAESDVLWHTKSIDCIWWRRPRRPYIPLDIHEDDLRFVQKENAVYHDSLPYLFDPNIWWVNPIESTYKTRSKLLQLKVAQACGFEVPETLVSNAPSDIKHFLQRQEPGAVIYKPFMPHFWTDADGMKILYTDKITMGDLPADEMLHIVPGIYQRYIEKSYELRVTCFGSYISAVKIDSQQHPIGQIDWRKIPGTELSLTPVTLKSDLELRLIRFMRQMGMVFGCFDLIVTPEGEIVFLEVNEQGQFLWIEDLLPDLCYMDIFAEFLIHKSAHFSWSKSRTTLSIKDYDAEAQRICAEQIKRHVYLNQVNRIKKA